MHLLYRRPLALFCCLAVIFICLSDLMNAVVAFLCICVFAILLLLFLFLTIKTKKPRFFLTFVCMLGLLLAAVTSFVFFQVRLPRMEQYIDRECVIEGTVIERTSTLPYASGFVVELDRIDGEALRENAKLECSYSSALQPGDRFSMTVTGRAFEENVSYDERRSSLADGIMIIFVCERAEDCQMAENADQNNVRVLLSKWNAALSYRLQREIGGREGQLAAALLLGDREALDPDITLAFSRTGVSHLLALSGLHISILIAFADLILRLVFWCPKHARLVIVGLLAVFYLFLTGCAPSTCRAVMMFAVVAASFYANAMYDGFTGLAIALLLILLISPASIFDLGMWMSFLAAGAIIVFLPLWQNALTRIHESRRLPKPVFRIFAAISTAFFVGLAANLAMVFVQATAFFQLPLLSVPHTMLLSLPITWTLQLSLITLIFPQAAILCRWTAGTMLYLTEHASELSYILIPMRHPVTLIFAFLLFLCLLFLALAKLKNKRWGLLPFALMACVIISGCYFTYRPCDTVRVDYLQKSGGELLLFSSEGQALVFDFSDGSGGNAYDIVLAAEEAQCVEIADLVISHYHNQASHFIYSITSQIKVRNLHLPQPQNEWEEGVARRMCEEAERHGVAVCFETDSHKLANLEIDLFARAPSEAGGHEALVLAVHSENRALVYANASLPKSTLFPNSESYLQGCDILIIGNTGYSQKDPRPFPYLYDLQTLFLAEEKFASLFPYLSEQATVKLAEEHLVFYLS